MTAYLNEMLNFSLGSVRCGLKYIIEIYVMVKEICQYHTGGGRPQKEAVRGEDGAEFHRV